MTTAATKPLPSRASAAAARPGGGSRASVDPVKLLRQHWILLVAMGFLGVGLGVGGYMAADKYSPRFAGRVSFELAPQLSDPLDTSARSAESGEAVLRAMRTEAQYLLNAEVLGRMLRESKEVRESTTWGRQFLSPEGTFAFDDAVKALDESLSTTVGRDINLFSLEWYSRKAEDVPVVLNAIAATYLQVRERREDMQYQRVLQQFEDRNAELDRRISDGQAQLDEFIRTNGLTDVENAMNTQISSSASDLLRNINEAIAQQGMARSVAEQTNQKLKGVTEFNQDDRRAAENDPNVRAMRTQLNQLRVAVAAVRDKFSATHPEVLDYERNLKAAESEYELAIRDRIRQDLEARMKDAILEAERADTMRRDLEAEYALAETKLRDTSAQIASYQNQRRLVDSLERQRDQIQEVIRDIRVMKGRDDARRVRIAFPAETPKVKSFPVLVVFVGLGGLFAVMLTGAGLFLRELLDQRVKGGSDLAAIPGARVIGTIPDIADDPTNCERAELVVSERPQSVLAETYRQASVPLMEALGGGSGRVLLFVGGLPGAGTTTVVSNIAAVEAAAGRGVLVLDANFRRPGIARVYGLAEDSIGLGDVLSGAATIDAAIQKPADGPHLITAGTPASRIYERLQNVQMDRILAELRSRYELVVVDSPPAVVAGESMVLARKSDAVVLVVRANQEQRGLVARLVRQLGELRGDFLGVILNRPRGTAGGYFRKNYATIAEYARPS